MHANGLRDSGALTYRSRTDSTYHLPVVPPLKGRVRRPVGDGVWCAPVGAALSPNLTADGRTLRSENVCTRVLLALTPVVTGDDRLRVDGGLPGEVASVG
jgi:hypothetical protein